MLELQAHGAGVSGGDGQRDNETRSFWAALGSGCSGWWVPHKAFGCQEIYLCLCLRVGGHHAFSKISW